MLIKNIKKNNRPREKAIKNGIESLEDHELLALIIKNGSKSESVLDLAFKIINNVGGFFNIDTYNLKSLKEFKGIGNAKALEIMALIEIIRRYNKGKNNIGKIVSNKSIAKIVFNKIADNDVEKLLIVGLSKSRRVILTKVISSGSNDMAFLDSREVLKELLIVGAKYYYISHNHPSGNSSPSEKDITTTIRLKKITDVMGVIMLDHIITSTSDVYFILGKIRLLKELDF